MENSTMVCVCVCVCVRACVCVVIWVGLGMFGVNKIYVIFHDIPPFINTWATWQCCHKFEFKWSFFKYTVEVFKLLGRIH